MMYYENIWALFIHFFVSIGLCFLLLFLVFFFQTSKANSEKNMAYECGFKPFDFNYYPFDVQFYRIGILFLLFDVEIMFFFPWVINFYEISLTGHNCIFIFILLLILGFLYEIKKGALIWYPQPWQNFKFLHKLDENV